MSKILRILLVIVIAVLAAGVPFITSQNSLLAQDSKNPYLVRTFIDEQGRQIDEIIVPGRPPPVKAAKVKVPEPNIAMGINVLSHVPAFNWSYGCSATSAAMLFGYYDNDGYHTNMYAGPTNAGVCPMNNSSWGAGIGGSDGECPLSATHQGKDGLAVRGHVDDYWISYGSTANDPYITGGWTQHTHADCTGDFMGTNQSYFYNTDGATTFYFYTNGAPLYDYNPADPTVRDGCHGLKLFVESRGYTVAANGNFSQYIYGYNGNTQGFTFDDFTHEIDAGRPVLIQVEGHTMLGYGYNTVGQIVYIHDTWDYSDHQMTWGGTYGAGNLQHYGVTVLRLAAVSQPTWESYRGNYGDSGGSVDDYFSDFASEHQVYMYGTGFSSDPYKIIYWDGDGNKRAGEIISPVGGTLKSHWTFTADNATAGNWHATVYTQDANPSSYSATDLNIVADDKSYSGGYGFHVEESAIPEFPTVWAVIVALALSAGVYLWLRRRMSPAPA
jgi:hypothetical protein